MLVAHVIAHVIALSSVASFSSASLAQEGDPLREALHANRNVVEWKDGQLAGPGAALLLEAGSASQFFLIGEEHGIAEIPELSAALFTELGSAGYRHLGIEIGDTVATRLEQVARSPEPIEALANFFVEHWPGVPFYTLEPEARLLVDAVAAVAEEGVLWGLDYDILGDRYALRALREEVATEEQERAVQQAIELADVAFERAMGQGNPDHMMMFGGPTEPLDALVKAFEAEAGSAANQIVSLLRETRAINQHWLDGEAWRSNERRAAWNKRQLGRLWREAWDKNGEAPRAFLKFGANHVMRGRTPTGVFDLGNVAASFADALGRPSFHLLVVGGPGTKRAQLNPTVMEYEPAPVELVASKWADPLAELTHPDQWTLFDLRPLRPAASAKILGELAPELERAIFGFDAVLILGGSTPAVELELWNR